MADNQSPRSYEERQSTAMTDLSSLGRVSHRLALVDTTERLEQVLDKLLPRLLKRIGDNHAIQLELGESQSSERQSNGEPPQKKQLRETHDRIHSKLVEMLSHTMKRVRDDKECKLPILQILNLLLLPLENTDQCPVARRGVDPFTLNLSLAFLTLGLPRSSLTDIPALLPGLFVLLGLHSGLTSLASPARRSQSHQVAHLLLRALERLTGQNNQKQSLDAKALEKQIAKESVETSMNLARAVLAQQEETASAVFDLLLDSLLYQPVAGNVPPGGMGQAGHERLIQGNSASARDWCAEMAPRMRLMEFKLAVLDFVAPSRRWAIFSHKNSPRGVARTVALLVVASGDSSMQISQRASAYLKIHLDSFRGATDTDEINRNMLGDVHALTMELLSLSLGQTNADAALQRLNSSTNKASVSRLGIDRASTANMSGTQQKLVLSMRRRQASEATRAAIMSFVGAKVLRENPRLLQAADSSVLIIEMGTLAQIVAQKTLAGMHTASGLSSQRAKEYIAAAQLLNTICIRLADIFDKLFHDKTDTPNERQAVIIGLLAKSLSTACSVLAPVSHPRPDLDSLVNNEGSIEVRDECYGVICVLSRSQFVELPEMFIFNKGIGSNHDTVSIETAALLFGCSTNEFEKLRPRAVAALDALLGAYCRVYANGESHVKDMEVTTTDVNPWASISADNNLQTAFTMQSTINTEGLVQAILPLLWASSQSSQSKSSRVAAARWSSELLKEIDLPNACHLLCFLAGDIDTTTSSIAREGLGLPKEYTQDVGETLEGTKLPDFKAFANIFLPAEKNISSTWRPRYWDFSLPGKATAVRYGAICFLNDMYDGEDEAVEIYFTTLVETLALFESKSTQVSKGQPATELLDHCCTCFATVLSISQHLREMVINEKVQLTLQNISRLALSATSSRARRHLAQACGFMFNDITLYSQLDTFDLHVWITKTNLDGILESCKTILVNNQGNLATVGNIHGATFLASECIRTFRIHALDRTEPIAEECWERISALLAALGNGVLHTDEAIANASSDGLSIALAYDTQDAPILDIRAYEGTITTLLKLTEAIQKFGIRTDHLNPIRALKLARAAGVCLAASSSGAGVKANAQNPSTSIGQARLTCVEALFNLLGSPAFRKDEEIALVAGEALALYADAFSPDGAKWSNDIDEWPTAYTRSFANELPPHQQVLLTLVRETFVATSPHKRTSCAPALLAIVARAAKGVHGNRSYVNRALVKELCAHLHEIQNVFISLLSDPKSKHLSRESCCLGLAGCQGLASACQSQEGVVVDELKHRLLRAFGQTTIQQGSAMQETSTQAAERRATQSRSASEAPSSLLEPFGEENEEGGTSGMGEAALGAYREMAAAAVSLGRPDVLYSLLVLSVSHAAWFSAGNKDIYGASSLLGDDSVLGKHSSSSEMRAALRPHLGKLLPRVLRACHDPNKETREQMSTLLFGLTGSGAESRLVISANLLPTIDALVDDASSKFWRARVGSCGALNEIIVGRTWSDLGGGPAVLNDDDIHCKVTTSKLTAGIRILRLWRVAMRALDDIRSAVRESGEKLARSVRSLSLRLCDSSSKEENSKENKNIEVEASAASATVLRWLLKHGLNQHCAEATGISVSCLVDIVDFVRPAILEPLIPDLLRSLLFAMSGLEPEALNYLQLRSTTQGSDSDLTYDRLERFRLQLAQSGPLASGVAKCLDILPTAKIETQRSVIPQLDSSLRLAAGFATRAATADAVATLCNTCPNAFKFSGVSNTNPSVRLLRALYFASERERGHAAREKMAHALGNLASLCPGSSVRTLALKACKKYYSSTGNHDDPASRRAAASSIRSIAVRATTQFSDGGPSNIWIRRVLPVAFLGQKDSDSKVASLWKEVWDEGSSVANVASSLEIDLGAVSIHETLLPYLIQECKKSLEDVSWSRRLAGARAIKDLCALEVLAPVPLASSTKAPSVDVRAQRRSQASCVALNACLAVLTRPRLWTGKSEVLEAAVRIAQKWTSAAVVTTSKANLYGWDNQSSVCPWIPVSVSTDGSSNDLFAGDDWFNNARTPGEDSEMLEIQEESKEEKEEETHANLSDVDNVEDDVIEKQEENEVSEYSTLTLQGLCRFMLNLAFPQTSKQVVDYEEFLPYQTAALSGVRSMLDSLNDSTSLILQKRQVFDRLSRKLLDYLLVEQTDSDIKPVLLARTIDCVAASFWHNIAKPEEAETSCVLEVARALGKSSGKTQPAWTVREAACLGISSFATKCDAGAFRAHSLVSLMVQCAADALDDRKFWKVRLAGLRVLDSLVRRGGTRTTDASGLIKTNEQQLLLEALLPQKEAISSLLRSSLRDSEAKVTALSTTILSTIAWWP